MISIEPTSAIIGAKVLNLSLADVPDQTTVALIDRALEQYGVLVFPDQCISPQQMVDFSAAFGPLEPTELEQARLEGYEKIFVVGNVGKGLVSFAPQHEGQELEWHTDHIHHETPARASLLYAKEVPEQGGDTLFACMYQAYNALDQQQKEYYCTLETINSASGLEHYLARQQLTENDQDKVKRKYRKTVRPLVRAHPVTGRRALYFGNQVTIGVVGWNAQKSREFINDLTAHACQPAFQYRHKWASGEAVLWDNRRVLHAGTPYDLKNSRRLMHRTTFRETKPIQLVD